MSSRMNPGGKFGLDSPIGALKTQLSKLLLSVDRIGWADGATSGRFDVRRSSRMLAGSERVFKSRTESKAVTTAVSIVVDLSGSMAGDRIEAAAKTAWALADAINRVGCMVQVVGFSGGYGNHRYSPKYMKNMGGESGKAGGLLQTETGGTAQVMKDWHHKLADRKVIFEYMHALVGGGTPDYQVVRTVTEQMVLVPAHRKLVIVITDGMGDEGNMSTMGSVSEKLWKVPVIGIGIQTSAYAMKRAYKYFACVQNLEELATGALRSVIAQLDKGVPA